jgi:hypothetical protein
MFLLYGLRQYCKSVMCNVPFENYTFYKNIENLDLHIPVVRSNKKNARQSRTVILYMKERRVY